MNYLRGYFTVPWLRGELKVILDAQQASFPFILLPSQDQSKPATWSQVVHLNLLFVCSTDLHPELSNSLSLPIVRKGVVLYLRRLLAN